MPSQTPPLRPKSPSSPPGSETSTVAVTLPTGWQVELPEAIHAHTSFAALDVTFRRDQGKLLEERKLVLLKKEVPVADFMQYQSWYDTAGAGSVPFLQLLPVVDPAQVSAHTTPVPPSSNVAARPSDPHAAELVVSAGDKIRTMDPDAARPLLDHAKAINPAEHGLWMGYAAIATVLHHPSLARAQQQMLRTLPLGLAKGRHGTAELRLLIVNGGVADTGPFSTDLAMSNTSYKPGLTDGPAPLKTADLH